MYLIPVSALTDNYRCLLHDGKPVMVVSRVDTVPPMVARNGRGPESKLILVTHHHGGYIKRISRGNGQCVRSPRGKAVCRRHQGRSADLHLALICEADNHGITAMRGIDYLVCTVLSTLIAIGQYKI